MSSLFKLFFKTFLSRENVADAKSRQFFVATKSPFSSTSLKIAFEADDFEEVRFELLFRTNGWFVIHKFSTKDQSIFPASSKRALLIFSKKWMFFPKNEEYLPNYVPQNRTRHQQYWETNCRRIWVCEFRSVFLFRLRNEFSHFAKEYPTRSQTS